MAVSEIDKHRRRWEENPKGLTFAPYADALRKAGEAEQALDVLRAGLEFHPDYIPANIVLGRCHLDLGDDAGAEGAFERVLSLDPENVIALKALADVNERAGRWSAATRWLEMLLSIDRGNDAAREQMERVQLGAVQAAAAAEVVPADASYAEPVPMEDHGQTTAPAVEAVPEPVAAYEDAIVLDAPAAEIDLGFAPTTDAPDAASTFETFQPASVSPDETTIVAPVIDTDEIVLEDRHSADAEFEAAADRTANEFAVEDAAASFSADTPDDVPAWSAIGKGEYVPSIFADESTEATADDTAIEPMGGLELERTDEPIFTASDAAPLMVASSFADASTIDDDVAIDGFAPTTEFDAVSEADAAPVASILDGASTQEDAIELDSAIALDSMPDSSDDAVVPEADVPPPAPEPVPVPSPVSMLALEPADVASLDASARAAAAEALAARAAVAPVDVLAAAPAPDPAVLLALAASATAALAMDADDDRGDAPSWGAWEWGDTDPDLAQLAVADEPVMQLEPEPAPVAAVAIEPVPADDAEFVEAVLPFDDAVASEPAPTAVSMEPELVEEDVPATALQEETPADEIDAVPPGFAAPVLVTAAMAALYEGQGHLLEALATYRELEARTPGAHGDKIASLEARVRLVSMPAPPVFAARISGGQPVHEFFGALLRTMPAALAPAAPAPDDEGPALRRAAEPMSLGRLFGEEPTTATRPRAVAARTASIDEFYGAAAPAAEAGGRDDLEQFHSWLQGLKT